MLSLWQLCKREFILNTSSLGMYESSTMVAEPYQVGKVVNSIVLPMRKMQDV